MIRRIGPTSRFGSMVRALAVAGALALSGPAIAQNAGDPPPPPDSQIVVNGEKQTKEEVRAQASAMVRKLGVAKGERPAARWTRPICPKVFGLRPEHAKIVIDRVTAAARDAGVRVAKGDCQPTIAISFVASSADFVQTIARKSPRHLREVSRADRERLLAGGQPVGWWYSTEVRGRDNATGGADAPIFAQSEAPGRSNPIPTTGTEGSFQLYNSSIVSTQSVRTISQAMIVVDVPKADGYRLSALSSYIAMVALSEIDYEPDPVPDSILSLFSGGKDLSGLTQWDRAFLGALYKVPLDRQAFQIRNALRTSITNEVVGDK